MVNKPDNRRSGGYNPDNPYSDTNFNSMPGDDYASYLGDLQNNSWDTGLFSPDPDLTQPVWQEGQDLINSISALSDISSYTYSAGTGDISGYTSGYSSGNSYAGGSAGFERTGDGTVFSYAGDSIGGNTGGDTGSNTGGNAGGSYTSASGNRNLRTDINSRKATSYSRSYKSRSSSGNNAKYGTRSSSQASSHDRIFRDQYDTLQQPLSEPKPRKTSFKPRIFILMILAMILLNSGVISVIRKVREEFSQLGDFNPVHSENTQQGDIDLGDGYFDGNGFGGDENGGSNNGGHSTSPNITQLTTENHKVTVLRPDGFDEPMGDGESVSVYSYSEQNNTYENKDVYYYLYEGYYLPELMETSPFSYMYENDYYSDIVEDDYVNKSIAGMDVTYKRVSYKWNMYDDEYMSFYSYYLLIPVGDRDVLNIDIICTNDDSEASQWFDEDELLENIVSHLEIE